MGNSTHRGRPRSAGENLADGAHGAPFAVHLAIQDETQAVLEYLADEFRKQLQFADRELIQTQELLSDAIDTLAACFDGIQGSIDCGAQGVREPAPERESLGHSIPFGDPARGCSRQLETHINTAIRTLQFQDIANQLIDHAMHRVSAMNDALTDIKTMSEEQHTDPTSFIDYLYRHKESILRKVANLDERKTNPVSQGHMGTGEIELF
jgi:hypothetical protein